jgi:putative tryptophan/tyrosine transport system substrate-binding protein
MIARREFITLLGGAATASSLWPIMAEAQQSALPVIGYFGTLSEDADRLNIAAYRRGLGEQGYVEGRNVEILYRRRDGEWSPERIAAVAEELVRRQVRVIYIPAGPLFVLAAKAATATIPIVFVNGTDPIESRLVASLNRPGGNVTGIYYRAEELTAKRLELLHEIAPAMTNVGFLSSSGAALEQAETAARGLGVKLTAAQANGPTGIEAAFAMFVERGIDALAMSNEGLFRVEAAKILSFAAQHRLPAIYHLREIVEAGGLMSYGTDVADACRIAGNYTGRILKGEKPADLSVQQSTRFATVVNLKTAKALGLAIPPTLLASADDLIE